MLYHLRRVSVSIDPVACVSPITPTTMLTSEYIIASTEVPTMRSPHTVLREFSPTTEYLDTVLGTRGSTTSCKAAKPLLGRLSLLRTHVQLKRGYVLVPK